MIPDGVNSESANGLPLKLRCHPLTFACHKTG